MSYQSGIDILGAVTSNSPVAIRTRAPRMEQRSTKPAPAVAPPIMVTPKVAQLRKTPKVTLTPAGAKGAWDAFVSAATEAQTPTDIGPADYGNYDPAQTEAAEEAFDAEAEEAAADVYAADVPLDLDSTDAPLDDDPWSAFVNPDGYAGDEVQYLADEEMDLLGDLVEEQGRQVADLTRRLNAIQKPTVAQAKVMLAGGQQSIQTATAKGSADRKQRREAVAGKLRWHADALAKMKSEAPYPHAADLRKWVLEAFIESNVADTAATWRTFDWMLSQIESETADIAARAGEVAQKPFRAAEAIANIPWWGWAAGALVLGYGLIRVAPVVAPVVARKYLG